MNPSPSSTGSPPSHPSQPDKPGNLGNLFERLARREQELISEAKKIDSSPLRDRPAETLPNLPGRFLPDPPPPYFDRVIVGHGLPVEYRESPDGEHYLNDGHYLFRPLNPDHLDNAETVTPGAISKSDTSIFDSQIR